MAVLDADLAAQDVATPAIVISRDHDDANARLAQVGQRGKNPKCGPRDHMLPFEPEVEQIAVDHQRASTTPQGTKEIENVPLHHRRANTEVRVREDVAGRRQHADILAGRAYLYNRTVTQVSSTKNCRMQHATRSELRVRYSETDQMGVVYHTNYLVWCEIGRTDFIRRTGITYAELERRGVLLAVSEVTIRYHAAARYDDPIHVETRLAAVRSRAVTFDYVITNGDSGARLASARTALVSLDMDGRPAKLPDDFRHQLEELVVVRSDPPV